MNTSGNYRQSNGGSFKQSSVLMFEDVESYVPPQIGRQSLELDKSIQLEVTKEEPLLIPGIQLDTISRESHGSSYCPK